MKVGDIVYRKAPFQVVGVGIEKVGDKEVTHLSLQAVETTQYINCLDTEVEPAAAQPMPSVETSPVVETPVTPAVETPAA